MQRVISININTFPNKFDERTLFIEHRFTDLENLLNQGFKIKQFHQISSISLNSVLLTFILDDTI